MNRRAFTKLLASALPASWLASRVKADDGRLRTTKAENVAPPRPSYKPKYLTTATIYGEFVHVEFVGGCCETWSIESFRQWCRDGGCIGTCNVYGTLHLEDFGTRQVQVVSAESEPDGAPDYQWWN